MWYVHVDETGLLLLECMWLMTLQYVYWQKCMVSKEANDQALQCSDGVNVLSSARSGHMGLQVITVQLP